MAYTTINKSTDYFNTVTFTGDGSLPRAITGVGHSPDFVWLKNRSVAYHHQLYDSVRGTSAGVLYSSLTDAEDSTYQMSSFDSDGYTMGSNLGAVNGSGENIVSWNWKANGAGSANTNGSISSTVSANTTAGFSIVSWTGSGADATVGHGLSSAPTIFIVKNRTDASTDWRVGQVLTSTNNMTDGNGYYMELNDTKASTNPGSANQWGSTPTAPTNQVFTVGSNNSNNGSSDNMIAYCFAEKTGYSKFGSYTGNGNADGTFVYTGFKPAFVLIKRATGASGRWVLWDSKRNPSNLMDNALFPNSSVVENDGYWKIDGLSNGFKIKDPEVEINASGATFIYMCFAEAPLVGTNNIPATAR